jgi:hypothetical protein
MREFSNRLTEKKFLATVSNEILHVIGFDPGESTGYVVLGIKADDLMYPSTELHNKVTTLACGTLNCHDPAGLGLGVRKHAGLNMFGENTGITQMISIVEAFPTAAIIVEDFIPDFRKMDQARHTLSPVRLMAGFSYGLSVAWETWGMHADFGLGEERIFVQNRSLAKTTCTDERLVNWGLNLKGESRHARDAMKHAFYFLKSAHNLRNQVESSAEIRHLAWPHVFEDPMITKKKRAPRPRPKGDRI